MNLGKIHNKASGHKQSMCGIKTFNVPFNDSTDRQTEGQGDFSIPPPPPQKKLCLQGYNYHYFANSLWKSNNAKHKTTGYNFYTVETCKQTICVHVWRDFVSCTTCTHFGKLLRRTLLAYSLRYFWNVLVRSIIGLPVLSWEHWTMHFL